MAGISKTYGSLRALDQVDFDLAPGEIMALLGENGAGKSTLVKVLAGLVVPETGTIEIDGHTERIDSSRDSQRAGIAVLQQEYSSVPCLSVAENLVLGDERASWWFSPRRARAATESLLAQVGLDHVDRHRLVSSLSVAEVQLLELARVLRRDARILIFDEPTAALSDAEIDRVLSVARRLADEGRSIIYVTHRLPEVFQIADRVTIFNSGRSSAPRPVGEMSLESVIPLMIGRRLDTLYPPRPEREPGPVRLEVTDLVAPGLERPVSLAVRPGEILGLTGQLGSGAGAVVQALAGANPMTGGTLTLDGVTRRVRHRRQATRLGIAFCSEDRKHDGMFQRMSVRANLSAPWLGRATVGAGWVSPGKERSLANGICEEFAISTTRLETPVELLSGGNQQKVVLGRWLGISPRVLIVEEPTRGVDVGARAELYVTLRALADAGTAVVVSSSDTSEILGLCDTIAAFYRGRLERVAPHTTWDQAGLVKAVMHRIEVAA